MKKRVLTMMKPKVQSLGFREEELEGVAEQITNNLTEDASSEDIEAEINKVLPYLQVSQKAVTRIVNAETAKLNSKQATEEGAGSTDPSNAGANQEKQSDDEPAWMKEFRESMKAVNNRLSNIESSKTLDLRKKRLESIAKDAGAFGANILNNFSRMKFESDDDFEAYFEEAKGDIATFKQEQADEALSKGGKPGGGRGISKGEPTKEDVEAVAQQMNL